EGALAQQRSLRSRRNIQLSVAPLDRSNQSHAPRHSRHASSPASTTLAATPAAPAATSGPLLRRYSAGSLSETADTVNAAGGDRHGGTQNGTPGAGASPPHTTPPTSGSTASAKPASPVPVLA